MTSLTRTAAYLAQRGAEATHAESAQATSNADLMILLFQIRMVVGDDPAEAGQRISGRCTRPT